MLILNQNICFRNFIPFWLFISCRFSDICCFGTVSSFWGRRLYSIHPLRWTTTTCFRHREIISNKHFILKPHILLNCFYFTHTLCIALCSTSTLETTTSMQTMCTILFSYKIYGIATPSLPTMDQHHNCVDNRHTHTYMYINNHTRAIYIHIYIYIKCININIIMRKRSDFSSAWHIVSYFYEKKKIENIIHFVHVPDFATYIKNTLYYTCLSHIHSLSLGDFRSCNI